jgi:parallel beta-helix repeat protein
MLNMRGSVKFIWIGAVAVIGWGICFWGFAIAKQKAGVYHEALRFKEGIELRGESPDTTIVRFFSPPTGVVGQAHYDIPLEIRGCTSGTILNIGFEQESSDERTNENIWLADAIELFDSSIAIENCRAKSDAGAGILIYGTKSAPTLLRNQCRQNKQGGISFEHL